MGNFLDKFKSILASGDIDKADDIEALLPELEAELDELDAITADGLSWDDADEILGDILPDVMKVARKHTKGKSADEIEELLYNFVLVLKVHYGWDVWMVPEWIERKAIRKIVRIVFKAISKDQKDPETDSTALSAVE